LILRLDPHPAIKRLRLSRGGWPAMWADDQTISKLPRRTRHIITDVDVGAWRHLLAVSIALAAASAPK
jgi:hypothetical protein